MSVSTARSTVEVYCPECNRPRWISPERATRIERGVVSPLCRHCKNLGSARLPSPEAATGAAIARADHTDDDLRWWFERFGSPLPPDVQVEPYVRQHGLPDDLMAVVASLPRPRV